MKSALYLISFVMAVSLGLTLSLRGEHPAEAAEKKLEDARSAYKKAEDSLLASLAKIDEPSKKRAAMTAFKTRKELWAKLVEADATFTIAASPLPDTSTSSSLVPFWREIHHLELQTKQLSEEAEWIANNWRNEK